MFFFFICTIIPPHSAPGAKTNKLFSVEQLKFLLRFFPGPTRQDLLDHATADLMPTLKTHVHRFQSNKYHKGSILASQPQSQD